MRSLPDRHKWPNTRRVLVLLAQDSLDFALRWPTTAALLRCHWLVVMLVVVAVLFGGPVGCGEITGGGELAVAGTSTAASVEASVAGPDLAVWPADDALATLANEAAARIEAATGLVVAVGPDALDSLPLLWTDRGQQDGWFGHWSVTGRSEWLAIDQATPSELHELIVLHEILHALGAAHIEERGGGVLSDKMWVRSEGWPLTAADLESVCSVRACSTFVPEKEPEL